MSMKNQKRFAAVYLGVGLLIGIIAVLAGDDGFNGGILSGMAASLTVIGAARLLKLRRLCRDPEKAADYEAASKDERMIYISNKARSLTFVISVYLQLAVGLVAQFAFGQRLLCQVLCYLTCFQCLLYVALFWFYQRKY